MRSPWSRIGRIGWRTGRAEFDRRTRGQEWLTARVRRSERPIRQRFLRALLRLVGLLLRLAIILRHRERAGIMPARKAHQRVDAAVDRRMRCEQVRESLARIVDA